MGELRRTPFRDQMGQLGGKFVDFHGWDLPVQFEGIIPEHRHVRENVGVFDVSHMGEMLLTGPRAVEAAAKLITNDIAGLEDGQACYSPICRPDGGIVDDLIAYRRSTEEVFICMNASNREKDYAWTVEQVGDLCEVQHVSDDYGQLALQGPKAPAVLAAAFPGAGADFAPSPAFRHTQLDVDGARIMVSTTGYTGELGFEIYIPVDACAAVWERLWEAGRAFDLKPIGLGARDTLRLESRFCLYGNDIDETTNPLEAGLGWTVKFDKPEFVGREALLAVNEEGCGRKLVGLKMLERGIPRQGYDVYAPDEPDKVVGRITSGTQSPTLGEPIALAYIDVPYNKRGKGRELLVDIRGRRRRAKVVRTPFVKR